MTNEASQVQFDSAENVWQSNGAREALLFTLFRVEAGVQSLLAKDTSLIARIKAFIDLNLEPLAAQGFDGPIDEALSEEQLRDLGELDMRLFELIARLSSDARTAILMAAIDIEATVNQFLFLHVPEAVLASTDRLAISAKLEIAHMAVGRTQFKGTRAYEAVKKLFDWRDAFAHGKLPGIRKSESLKDMHLRKQSELPTANPQRDVNEMLTLLDGYLLLNRHLLEIMQKPPIFTTLATPGHIALALARIREIPQTEFEDYSLTATEKRNFQQDTSRGADTP